MDCCTSDHGNDPQQCSLSQAYTDVHGCELQVEAHHFCACPNEEVRQCVIYDSDRPDARLIGTEYIISDKLFETLPEEEKVYWHSHKFEVQSGTLQVPTRLLSTAASSFAACSASFCSLQNCMLS